MRPIRMEPGAESLITYPSEFPIKVMGANVQDFAQIIAELVREHDPAFDAQRMEHRPSKAGNYLGLTVIVNATSWEQLDRLYLALTSHPMVKVVL